MTSLRYERQLLRGLPGASTLAAIDEVGRGALAGPVAVGVVIVDLDCGSAPRGVRDSKACPPDERRRLAPRIRRWARSCAVGMASAREIDDMGIMTALALAAVRALNCVGERPSIVLLDGNHNWLRRQCHELPVVTRVSGDATCAAVAAASILAKVMRDDLMVQLAVDHPEYGWAANKGYASPDHIDALSHRGPSPHHRVSWSLPGLTARPGLAPSDTITA